MTIPIPVIVRRTTLLAALLTAVWGLPSAAQIPYPTLTRLDAGARQKVDQAHAVVVADPSDGAAWGRYGMILDAHNLGSEAETAYREASRLSPDEARWPYFLAILLDEDDPAAALEWYERAVALSPGYAPARLRLATALEVLGRAAEAEEHYRVAAELDPNDPLAALGQGRLALAADRVEEAVRHLERAYDLNASIHDVAATLSEAYARSGRDDLARARAAEAAELPHTLPQRDPLYASMIEEAQLTPLRLIEVEHPSTERMEDAVREQLAASRERLETVLSHGRGVSARGLGEAFGNLGELYLIYDLTDAARACLTNAAALLKDEPRWPYLLGTSFEHDRDLENARRWYGAAASLDDTYVPTLIRFGKVALLQGKLEEAAVALERARELDPESAAAHAWLGRAALRGGEPQRGVELLLRALELQPRATALHYELAQGYRALGDTEAAAAHLAERGDASVSFPDPIGEELRGRIVGLGAAVALSGAALRDGNVAAAEAHARAAVVAEPTNPSSHRLLGSVLATAGKREEAIRAFERAVELDPADVGLRLGLTRLLIDAGKDGEIVALLEEALPTAPDHAPLHAELGAALTRLGRLEEANERLAEAERLDPEHDGVALLRASVFERLGRTAEATAELERLVDLSPDLAEVRLLLARKLIEQERPLEAIGHLEAAVAIDPEDLEARELLAFLHGRRGNYLEAAAHQEVVVRLRPEAGDAHLLLATARILGGELEAARTGLIEALSTHQSDPRIADALARLLATAPDEALRDGDTAVQLSSRVFRDQPSPDHGETLAMAFAEAGNFSEAIALQERILEQRRAADQEDEVTRALRWLDAYRNGTPVRSPWE